eukprot:TRINITY_DN23893_c0_g1_i2.p1 TRINITY_DN23893_c0_g1~~TRINITY_DN23893_c0_g1_i2.p1  ORF type:complete len:311 (-),score=39.95 TRINITY_DN23893_c0_g1_i2:42-842(-)
METFFVVICVSFVMTAILNWQYFEHNPVKTMLGYNSVIVGVTAPPAVYFSWALCTPTIYLGIRYAVVDSRQALLNARLRPAAKVAISVANYTYAVSQAAAWGLFVVRPSQAVLGAAAMGLSDSATVRFVDFTTRLHVALFFQLVPMIALVMHLNLWEAQWSGQLVTKAHWTVAIIHGILSLTLTVLVATTMGLHEHGEPWLYSPKVLQALEHAWLAFIPFAVFVRPSDIGIELTSTRSDYEEVGLSRDLVEVASDPFILQQRGVIQ